MIILVSIYVENQCQVIKPYHCRQWLVIIIMSFSTNRHRQVEITLGHNLATKGCNEE